MADVDVRLERAFRRLALAVAFVLALALFAALATLYVIVDCTRPGWTCYERGQRAGGELVRQMVNDNRQIHGQPTIPPAPGEGP